MLIKEIPKNALSFSWWLNLWNTTGFLGVRKVLSVTFWENTAINPAKTQLINPLTCQYFWLQGSWAATSLSLRWLLLWVPQGSSFQADSAPLCETNTKLFLSRVRGTIRISKCRIGPEVHLTNAWRGKARRVVKIATGSWQNTARYGRRY